MFLDLLDAEIFFRATVDWSILSHPRGLSLTHLLHPGVITIHTDAPLRQNGPPPAREYRYKLHEDCDQLTIAVVNFHPEETTGSRAPHDNG